MDKYFNHRKYCIKEKRTSRFEKIYYFEFPNGEKVMVSRDQRTIEGFFGCWRVATYMHVKGVRVESVLGYKRPRGVEKLLKWVKELKIPD